MSETAGVALPGVAQLTDTKSAVIQSAVIRSKIAAAIVAATQEVFSVMLGLEIQAAEACLGQIAQDHTGVVAVLGLTGEWAGTGQVACDTAALACQIAGQLLMAEYEEVGEDVLDAVAEVANMVVGNVKNALEATLGSLALSTPSVIFGGSFETRVTAAAEAVLVPFQCRGSQMTVQIVIAPRGKRCQRAETTSV